MKKILFPVLIIVLILVLAVGSYFYFAKKSEILSEKNIPAVYKDIVKLRSPLPGDIVSSPLRITGEARGNWYFEASFPIILTNWDGLIIAEGFATAQDEWMTTEFVPFEAMLEFDVPEYGDNGYLILKKDNPSGLPEHDDAFEIQVQFAG